MKKALLLLAAAAACAIALPATAARNKTLKGSGKIVTETRDVGSSPEEPPASTLRD